MAWGSFESSRPAVGTPPQPGECHVWAARVGDDDAYRRGLLDDRDLLLAEQGRTGDLRTVIASRAVQRIVAARYLGIHPTGVAFRRTCGSCGSDTHGRPELVTGGSLDYSVSHHGEWIIMAVVGSGLIGVDLESRRPLRDADDLADAVLTPDEADEYAALPDRDRAAWFYRTWVRKEATVKVTVHGLGLDPSLVDVRGDAAVVGDPWATRTPNPIHLRDLPAPRGHAAALASTWRIAAVRWYRVPGP